MFKFVNIEPLLIEVLVKGVEELSIGFYDQRYTNGFLGVVVAILYSTTVYLLEKMRGTILFTPSVRDFLSDYAYPVSISFPELLSLLFPHNLPFFFLFPSRLVTTK
jgi:hypothetical protein